MGRLILHIGTHKTATTAIQHALSDNRETLLRRGVWYPGYELVGRSPHYAHLGMVNALSRDHKHFSRAEAERFFAIIRERSQDFDATVISAEPFYRHIDSENLPEELSQDRYWPCRNLYVDRIADMFGDAEIVVVFRRQVDYAESLYQEHVKVTQYSRTFERFMHQFWFHFDYLAQAEAWSRRFNILRVLRFDDLVATADPAHVFLSSLALDASGLIPSTQRNISMPPDAAIMKRMLNREGKDSRKVCRKLECLFDRLSSEVLPRLGRRSYFRDSVDLEAFQARFSADNAELKARFMPEMVSDMPLFDLVNTQGRVFGDQLHPQVLDALIRLAINAVPLSSRNSNE